MVKAFFCVGEEPGLATLAGVFAYITTTLKENQKDMNGFD